MLCPRAGAAERTNARTHARTHDHSVQQKQSTYALCHATETQGDSTSEGRIDGCEETNEGAAQHGSIDLNSDDDDRAQQGEGGTVDSICCRPV